LNSSADRSTKVLAQGRMRQVTSLAYDWTADTLYWADEDESVIEMMRSDGRFRKRLIANHSLVIRPTKLAVDPIHGWVWELKSVVG